MMLCVQPLQAFLRHMGVNLRRRNIAVAEEQLYDAQIGTVVEQVRRECVAQAVG